jgi:transcriptional regulator with XRE-family HTH domain
MDMQPEWFAGRLRELRARAGLSQQQLADKAGLKVGGIRDLEQGRRIPGWDTVLALCTALNVGCDAFTQEPGDLPPPTPGRPRKKPEALTADVGKPPAPSPDAAEAAGAVGPAAMAARKKAERKKPARKRRKGK